MKELIELIENNEPFLSLKSYYHGKEHARRVLDLALRLADKVGGDRKVLVISALLHDVGRVNEGVDASHGPRGALMAREFILKHKIDVDADLVYACISRHSIDNPGPGAKECMIIGDADKLDRFRLPECDSLDPSYLELPESHSLISYAKKLNN